MSRFERIASQRIYQQIVDQISRLIQEGTLKPGDRLPSERQLAEEFDNGFGIIAPRNHLAPGGTELYPGAADVELLEQETAHAAGLGVGLVQIKPLTTEARRHRVHKRKKGLPG